MKKYFGKQLLSLLAKELNICRNARSSKFGSIICTHLNKWIFIFQKQILFLVTIDLVKIDIHRTCGLYVLSRRIKHNLKKAVQNSLLRIVDSAEYNSVN